MQATEVKSLGYKLNYNVPSSIEEFDQLAKESGAGLREANRNVLYRSVLAQFRNAFLHGLDADEGQEAIEGLDKLTGVERNFKVTKPEVRDGDGKITQEEVSAWDETEDEYYKRVMATLVKNGNYPSVEAAEAAFAGHAQAVLSAIPFDPSKTERKSSGPKKVPATYVDVAKEIIAQGGADKAAAKLSSVLGRTVEANEASLAQAVWDDQKRQKKQLAAGYTA